jgi:hypothetical protein
MKIISILLNIALIILTIPFVIATGALREGGKYLILPLLTILIPLINLLYISFWREESWLTLYFKRKSLEEKKKIEELANRK